MSKFVSNGFQIQASISCILVATSCFGPEIRLTCSMTTPNIALDFLDKFTQALQETKPEQ